MAAIKIQTLPLDPLNQIITLLDQLRSRVPFAEEELAYHLQLQAILTEQQEQSATALAAWRAALAQRWECEVRAQRMYATLRRQLLECSGPSAPYLSLCEPDTAIGTLTASDLLNSLRRLAAVLSLIQPQPPFAEQSLPELQAMITELQAAIAHTERCEEERRRVQAEQRLLQELCQRAYQRTRHRIAAHLSQ
ncbi:MAG: hypothetical protein K6356_01545 [Chloroflexus sp.]